jgi:folate-binding protein YgfZ
MSATAAFAALHSRVLVRIGGADWRDFLQGLLTQDVETLAPGELRFAGLLTPQGKLLFDLFLLGTEVGCLIDVAADRRDALIQRLTIYRLRAKVEITADPGRVQALWGSGPGVATDWFVDPRLPALGWRGYVAAWHGGASDLGEAGYDAHRLALGVPDPAKDAPLETTYPLEANFDLLNGVDFKKGCFVGQETTSRMKRRGVVKSRMLPLRFDGPPPAFGAEVLAGTLRAGEVRSGADGAAMALVRLDRIEGAELTVDGRAVEVERPGYLGSEA